MRYLSEMVTHEVFDGYGVDAHGNEVERWKPGVSLGIYAFNPGGSVETGAGDRVVTEPTIYVQSTAVVGSRDRVTVRGVRFEVDGEPLDFRNPYDSSMDSISVSLKAVSG